MDYSPKIRDLIAALRVLPGVGQRSAQRMAFHLLERNRAGGQYLAQALLGAMEQVGQCGQCRDLSETPVCQLCAHPGRDASLLCIVESPADVMALEQTGSYRGRYFVLHGHLSPLDGIGPQQLGFGLLAERLAAEVLEVIIATNPTVEGDATARYIAELAHAAELQVSRIAQGVPVGTALEQIDAGTLSRAVSGRNRF